MPSKTYLRYQHYVPKKRLLRFITTYIRNPSAYTLKTSYDITEQPNVEFLWGRSFKIEKIGGSWGSGEAKSSISGRQSSSKSAIIGNPLELDVSVKKKLWSPFHYATFVKISSKSDHFYFFAQWIWDSRILESQIRPNWKMKVLGFWWNFHKSCVMQRRS